MAHLHITSWVIAFALVALVTTFTRSGNEKAAKISHMILRVDYLLVLYSGGSLFASYANYDALVIIKLLVGLWAVAAMEMVCIKYKKKQPAASWWGQLLIAAIIALVLGFGFLELGILP
ncbi:YisL family protein [Halobacillus shinanisalinarum]|uniref:YisL family protein n=1 Tax=Halobacillus shinanisalinarum TaxID=2932258 RepID=A0ABY4GY07_9BACI|nr:YisL family protein [Halobacillus shinanisalinarum]UOQ92805.1 YisL family protein [Halobacillus shinanisalinarum]